MGVAQFIPVLFVSQRGRVLAMRLAVDDTEGEMTRRRCHSLKLSATYQFEETMLPSKLAVDNGDGFDIGEKYLKLLIEG